MDTPTSNMLERTPGTYDWTARFWPPMEGNPFLSLVDPAYSGNLLKERGATPQRFGKARLHKMAEPPELPDELE